MVQHHEQPGHHHHHRHHHKGHHHHHHPHESNSDHLKHLSQPQKFPDTPDNHDGAVGKKSEDPDSRLNLYDKKSTVAAVAQEVGTTVTYRAQHTVKQDGSQGRPSGEEMTRIGVTESQTQATASGDSEHDRDQDHPHGRSQNSSEVRYWFLFLNCFHPAFLLYLQAALQPVCTSVVFKSVFTQCCCLIFPL